MKEAELYLTQGLFEEAKGIYLLLLKQAKSQIDQKVTIDDPDHAKARTMVRFFQAKLEEIEDKRITFYVQREGSDATIAHKAEGDGEAVFNRAVAFRGIGLYDEAIEEFRHAAKLGYKVKQCDREIADALVLNGDFREAIEIYYALLDDKEIENADRVGIFRNLARAYEGMGDDRKAEKIQGQLTLPETEMRDQEPAIAKEEDRGRRQGHFHFSIAWVTEHPRISFALTLIIALFFMAFLPFVKTVNNVDYFTLEHDPDVQFYDEFKEIFGNDEFFVIAFEKDDIFTEKNLGLLRDITTSLEGVDEIKEVTSLANVDDIVGGADYFEVMPFLEDIPSDVSELGALKSRALKNPLYVHNLISKDARTAGILVETYKRPEDPDYRKKVIEKTGLILKAFSEDSSFFHMAGWTNTNLSLSQYMKKDIATFIPITYLFITLAIWLIFRNVRLVLLAVLNISMCVGSTMGLFGLIGIKINNVTTIIPPLVMALALCDTVHIFSHMERAVLEKAGDKRKALAAVLQKVLVPSFLTTLTTGIGFLSLAVSRIPPIREFAWIASAGMAFEFLYSFFLLPPLILLFNPMKVFQAYETRKGMNGLLGFVANVVQSHARLIVMAGAMVVMTAFWFATQLQVETNLLEFFKKDSPLRQSITFVEKRLGGVDTLDISLRAEEEDAFKDPENLRILEKVQEFIASLEGVDYTVSFVDLLKDMNESFHEEDHAFYEIPESRDLVAQYLLLYDSEDLENLVNSTFDHARIAVRTSRHSSSQQADLIIEIWEFIERMNAPPHINLRVTGRAVQDVNTIDALVNGQVYSLALAAAVITVLMFFVMKSVKMGLLSIVPNVFPIIINFGIMGALGISLDTGTSLIAAVALGIAVDDTIHFLSEYRRSRSGSRAVSETVREVIFTKGRAIVSSSAILCIGFGVLVLSRFAPTMNFGMLSAIIMITALIGDLVVLPSVILLKRR